MHPGKTTEISSIIPTQLLMTIENTYESRELSIVISVFAVEVWFARQNVGALMTVRIIYILAN